MLRQGGVKEKNMKVFLWGGRTVFKGSDKLSKFFIVRLSKKLVRGGKPR